MRALLCSLLLGCVSCGERDGVVGVQRVEGGAAGSASLEFLDELADSTGSWDPQVPIMGATTAVGIRDSVARDGFLAELRFPGHESYDASERVGPQHATQLATRELFHFGTFRTRLAFGTCSASEEVVLAFLGFFNDGTDQDGDGIVDDLEINVQVLCSDPSKLYLTVFTDNEELQFRKRSRLVDFATGEQFDTPRSDSDELEPTGASGLVLERPFAEGRFQELGFEWRAEELRFFLHVNGEERTLWTLSGREQVPQRPVYVMYNSWHPETHWYPPQASAAYPARDVWLRVDWFSFTP
jgi:hypothetical protein